MAKAKSVSNGKLIDTWHYDYQTVPDPDEEFPSVETAKAIVKLYIYKKFTGETPPLSTKEVWFEVVCDAPEIKLIGSDIEALRAAMWGELDQHHAVKWEDYFLVSIDHRSPYEGVGTGLSYGYDTVRKGTAFDGTLLLKQYRYGRGEVISPWPGEFKDKNGNVVACIPATKENRQSLKEFAGRIDILREKLIDLVRPENIQNTLLTLSSIRLLPSADQ